MITLPYESGNYKFELNDINVSLRLKLMDVVFKIYKEDGTETNHTYTVTRSGEEFDVTFDFNNYSLYYKMLAVEIGADPSLVPDNLPVPE